MSINHLMRPFVAGAVVLLWTGCAGCAERVEDRSFRTLQVTEAARRGHERYVYGQTDLPDGTILLGGENLKESDIHALLGSPLKQRDEFVQERLSGYTLVVHGGRFKKALTPSGDYSGFEPPAPEKTESLFAFVPSIQTREVRRQVGPDGRNLVGGLQPVPDSKERVWMHRAAVTFSPPPWNQGDEPPRVGARRCVVVTTEKASAYFVHEDVWELDYPFEWVELKRGDAFEYVSDQGKFYEVYMFSGEPRYISKSQAKVENVTPVLPRHEQKRRRAFEELLAAEDEARERADEAVSPGDIARNAFWNRLTADELKLNVMREQGLSPLCEAPIVVEGVQKGWMR